MRRITILLMVAACGGEDGGGGPDSLTAQLCGDLKPTCPASPDELGTPGAFKVDSKEFTWKKCDKGDGYSYADFQYFQVPSDIVSIGMTVNAGATRAGFLKVQIGDNEHLTPETLGQGPHGHIPNAAVTGSIVLPMSQATDPGAGCLAIMPIAQEDVSGQTAKLDIATRRGGNENLLDVNFIVVEGVQITENEVQLALDRMFNIYVDAGAPDFGDGQLLTTNVVGTKIAAEGADVNKLRAYAAAGSPQAMNIFFIDDVLNEPGTLGFATNIPGPNGVRETVGSGVIIAVDSHRDGNGFIDTDTLGETIAHEVGHQMGLFHTSESDGSSHDFLDDTPQCTSADDSNGDKELSAEECANKDGAHMMFWTAGIPQTEISPNQVHVIKNSPIAY